MLICKLNKKKTAQKSKLVSWWSC